MIALGATNLAKTELLPTLASSMATLRASSLPSSDNCGSSPPRPESLCVSVRAVLPCLTKMTVVNFLVTLRGALTELGSSGLYSRSAAVFLLARVTTLIVEVPGSPTNFLVTLDSASIASLANESAFEFCSLGIHSKVTSLEPMALAISTESSCIPSFLIFQRPDICSTTSLLSILTRSFASGAISLANSIAARTALYSATLLVATPMNSAISARIAPESKSIRTAPEPAGPGLPLEPPSASINTL